MPIFLSLLIITIAFISLPIYAEEARTTPPQAVSSYLPSYNIETIETLKGNVYKAGKYPVLKGKYFMSFFTLGVINSVGNYEYINVHLGPASVIENMLKLAEKDEVEVEGSRVPWAGKNILIAAEITTYKDGKTIKLRDDKGIPFWSKK